VAGSSWVCLMYHDVSLEPPALTGGSNFFSVSRPDFARQLAQLEAMGLHGCSLAEMLRDSANRVAVTFDDGDLGQAERAFPELAARGMSATFFVTTGWIGRPGYASWDQLREMRAAGMAIESHTHTHPFLSELDEAALRDELRRSRDLLDERLDQRTAMLALPGGDAPGVELRRLLAEQGYSVVATSVWGINARASGARSADGIRWVRRCTVRGAPSEDDFRAIVLGSAWLRLKRRSRERVLAFIRSTLGPTRYARWRRGVLDAAGTRVGER
jgi:peptidoglycan/xylan/chitin deacetylase (PgdA/CDA1 family)